MQKQENRGGAVFWIFFVLLIICGFCGYKIGQLYFDAEAIRNEVAKIADDSLVDPRYDVKLEVSKTMIAYGVRLDPETVRADYNDRRDRVTVAFMYSREAHLGVMTWPVQFQVTLDREARKAAGVVQGVQNQLHDISEGSSQGYQRAVKDALSGGQ